ncbi:MAG: methyltransferase domain-containing protein [Pseudomonadota bacterium]
MRVLVAIANHGTSNDRFVRRLIEAYRSMSHDVSIVLLSNIEKDLGTDIEVAVGLPSENPWSLPFAYKQIFFDRRDDFDLFIYSEDDTLISERNIEAYFEAEAVLPHDHIAGFIRHEIGEDGTVYYSTVHGSYHWDPASVMVAGGEVFASFTNEHAAAFMLSKSKLAACIDSGGFMREPYEARYDMLCSAATDPYTQCGLTKVVCISRIDDFSLHHLPNKYIGKIGVLKPEIDRHLAKLIEISSGQGARDSLVDGRVRVSFSSRYDRVYFSEPFPSIMTVMPGRPCRILSIGCDCGRTESILAEHGHTIDAIPLDPVIAESARMRGVNVLDVDLTDPAKSVSTDSYDLLLFHFCLPFIEDPAAFISSFTSALRDDGQILVPFWNWQALKEQRQRYRERKTSPEAADVGIFERSGLHQTDAKTVSAWLRKSGFGIENLAYDVPRSGAAASRWSGGVLDRWLARTGTVLSTAKGL